MMDEVVGHMTEKVVIPRAEEIEVEPRRWTSEDKSTFQLFAPCGEEKTPMMAKAGDGYQIHVTGLTHDERGYPNMTPVVQERMVKRLVTKIRDNAEKICLTEQRDVEGADVVVISYGITSRVSQRAVEMARAEGLKVGSVRLITAWPFPEHIIRAIAPKVKGIVVAELNLGQMVREVERCAHGECKVKLVGHAGGTVHKPEEILKAIQEVAR
jgi:2-oxoglutarate ferredoxin oxidoreductase subunit alpha